MIQRHTVIINGTTFDFEQMASVQSTQVLLRLTRAVSEPFARFAATSDATTLKDLMTTKAGLAHFGEALSMVAHQLDDATFAFIVGCLFKGLQIEGKAYDNFGGPLHESVFRGKPRMLLQAIWEGLRFNYADFFDAGSQ